MTAKSEAPPSKAGRRYRWRVRHSRRSTLGNGKSAHFRVRQLLAGGARSK